MTGVGEPRHDSNVLRWRGRGVHAVPSRWAVVADPADEATADVVNAKVA